MTSEDHFSKLPKDCLLHVFKFEDRDTLDELKCVCNGFHSIAIDPSLKKIKKPGKLFVIEHPWGHGIYLNEENGGSLSFQIGREMDDAERNLLLKEGFELVPTEGVRNRSEQPLPDTLIKRERPLQLRSYSTTDATCAPPQVFDNIAELLGRFDCRPTVFEVILIDEHFIERCHQAFSDTANNEFVFCWPTIDEGLDPVKFAEFLSNVALGRLEFGEPINAPSNFYKVFDAAFLDAFLSAAPTGRLSLRIVMNVDQNWAAANALQQPFKASKYFLPLLDRFELFELCAMAVAPEQVMDLIAVGLDRTETSVAKWRFSLSSAITAKHLRLIDSSKYTCSVSDATIHETNLERIIKKIGRVNYCQLYVHDNTTGRPEVTLTFNDHLGFKGLESVEELLERLP